MSYYSCNNRTGCGCNSCQSVLGSNTCGCNNNNNSNSCQGIAGQQSGTCGCSNRPYYPFPPIGAVCGTCPPGTRPCNQYWSPYWNNGNCSCGCGNQSNSGSYAFFNSTGSTLTTGSVVPLRYVIGSGTLGRGTTGGVVNLDAGIYSAEYSLNATADTAGSIVTVTPEYLGALHPEYSRSFTTSVANQSFDIAGSFVANLPTDTTLSLIVTITDSEGTTSTATLTSANASMLIRRISGCGCGS